MSYDLFFWREDPPTGLKPDEVLELLCTPEYHESVKILSEETILEEFRSHFPDIVETGIGFDWEGSGSYYQATFNRVPIGDKDEIAFLGVSCGYQLLKAPETLNKIIDAANKLGCTLYDPHFGERNSG